jgi:ABC-type sugar transport system permease subunit
MYSDPSVRNQPQETHGRRTKLQRILSSEVFAHWILILPVLFFLIPFQIVPILTGLGYSLTNWSGMSIGNVQFIGLENYVQLIDDRLFLRSVKTTALFVTIVAPSLVILSLLLALALNRSDRLSGIGRTVALVPMAMSPVSIGILFGFFFSPTLGLPSLLREIGKFNILDDPLGALIVVILAQLWSTLGVNTFVFLSGLQAIPEDIHEAAVIDGASAIKRFFAVTLPLLRETLVMNAIVTLIGAINAFGLILVMTAGGPYHATEVLAIFMYKTAFFGFRYGYGSAVAVVMFAAVAIITFIQMRISRSGQTQYY